MTNITKQFKRTVNFGTDPGPMNQLSCNRICSFFVVILVVAKEQEHIYRNIDHIVRKSVIDTNERNKKTELLIRRVVAIALQSQTYVPTIFVV